MRLNFGIVLLASLALMGCSTFKRKLTDSELDRIHRIGVVSVLGTDLHQTFVGERSSEYRDAVHAVPEWTIDPLAERALVKMLTIHPHSRTSEVLPGRWTLADFERDDLRRRLFASARSRGIDLVVVLGPADYSELPGMHGGYGLYRTFRMDSPNQFTYLLAQITVYDTTTERRAAWEWTFGGGDFETEVFGDKPIVWKESFGEFSSVERERIAEGIRGRIGAGIEYAIHALRLD